MKGVNKAIIVGHLGQDPDMRSLQNGDAVCSISVATSESWKDKNTGEAKEKTEWHRIVAFRRLAEIMGEYLTKGSPVYIEGKLRTRKWQDQDGNDRYTTEIVADQMQMLGGRSDGQQRGDSQRSGGQQQRGSGQQRGGQRQAPPDNYGGDFDDDIPFDSYQKGWFV